MNGDATKRKALFLGGVLWLTAALCALGTTAGAHAFLSASTPAADSTVTTVPKDIRLTYSEPVEIRLSIFKVFKINAVSGADMRTIRSAAESLVAENLITRGDEAVRSDAGIANTTRDAADIILRLKHIEPGVYVVMWRVLSVDSHVTRGSFVFVYASAGQ